MYYSFTKTGKEHITFSKTNYETLDTCFMADYTNINVSVIIIIVKGK